jgi:thiamine-monophosphate kinase
MNIERSAPLSDVGEFALIEAFVREAPLHSDVVVGPGDDGAVVRIVGDLVTSIDLLVEGIHFKRDWSDAKDVGRKAVAVNVADIEAMGARALGVVVGLSAPPTLHAGWALDMAAGLRQECDRAGISLLGGDLTRGSEITIAVTALGSLEGRPPLLRSGARAGQVVAVAGHLGFAAAGLVALRRGFRSPRAVVDVQRVPNVPYGQGAAAAAAGATAMIDVSDGLLADLGHVARASGVVIDLRSEAFVPPAPLRMVAAAPGQDLLPLLLTGGEDHALAATFPAAPPGWCEVGAVRACAPGEQPTVLVDSSPWAGPGGYDHFRRGRR